jgi:hypothetical protein
MTLQKQNPAANVAHRVREFDQAGQRVDSEYKENGGCAQRLIACVTKSGREEFRIMLKDFNGTVKAEIRVFERKQDGIWNQTPRHIVIGRGAIAEIINALVEAEARL